VQYIRRYDLGEEKDWFDGHRQHGFVHRWRSIKVFLACLQGALSAAEEKHINLSGTGITRLQDHDSATEQFRLGNDQTAFDPSPLSI
jgi:hypothetical protein